MHKNVRILTVCSNRVLLLLTLLSLLCLGLLMGNIYDLTSHRTPTLNSTVSTVLLGLVFGVVFFIKQMMVARMVAISETAETIIRTGDLSRRIPLDKRWDDLSSLSNLLNTMLAEIEKLVTDARNVADNVSHDLRTPLTRLRNHIEDLRVSAGAFQTIEEQQEQYRQLTGECDALLETFQALLRISNIESGHKHSAFQPMNISSLLNDVVELYEPLAMDKQIAFTAEITPQLQFVGDKDLLFQSFANLLDNAIKYTPQEGQIRVALKPASSPQHVEFVLADSGPGISDDNKPLVFRRFFRVEQCRSKPGTGLGLSLVAAIVALHKGNIRLGDNAPSGLVTTITL